MTSKCSFCGIADIIRLSLDLYVASVISNIIAQSISTGCMIVQVSDWIGGRLHNSGSMRQEQHSNLGDGKFTSMHCQGRASPQRFCLLLGNNPAKGAIEWPLETRCHQIQKPIEAIHWGCGEVLFLLYVWA
jgi:hypothetical protein